MKNAILWTSIICAFVSAALWFLCAAITVIPLGWLDGPPNDVVKKIKRQGRLNAAAAAMTGISVALQAVAQLMT